MPQIYNEKFRKKIVRLHLQEGRTYKSLIDEFGVSKASISKWCKTSAKNAKPTRLLKKIQKLCKRFTFCVNSYKNSKRKMLSKKK